MVLTHLDSRDGEVLVLLPTGERRWVNVGDMIALANSDKEAEPVMEAVNSDEDSTEFVSDAPKAKKPRAKK
ncbi:MAG: hypothetical protein E6Q97_10670 [Desulfurellales bacterium]|nr:MAG: hypothetical protein E6Q97_10670 [Desulfurellales bacterium]